MRLSQPGNGSGKFDVGVHDMGGWVRVIAGGTAPQDGNLPFYLADRLSHWLGENAHRRLLCVVPISRDGNTVELHAWYEYSYPNYVPLPASAVEQVVRAVESLEYDRVFGRSGIW
jgi:hypothetical protein